jgi:6-phosphogluconolactonase (cycloisomerase 2 family)
MKLKNIGRAAVALAASAVAVLGMSSCTTSFTVGYMFITGAATGAGTTFGQIASYKITNNTGQLVQTSITSSAGVNPIQAVVSAGGSYVYVLNAGCGNQGQAACSNGGAAQASQIDLFSVGGSGRLTHQATYFPRGTNTLNIQINGNFLYAVDQYAPADPKVGGLQTIGDISAFGIDSVTGRLTTLLNNQQNDSTGLPLPYFPVGTNPVWLSLSGSFAFVAEQGAGTANDPAQAIFIYNQSSSTGQLTPTQSTPTPTGATQLTYVYATGSTVYALDAGTTLPLAQAGGSGVTGQILIYTVASGGTLGGGIVAKPNTGQNSLARYPFRMIVNDSRKFVWVANAGVNTDVNAIGSVITAYVIQTNNELADANNGGNLIPTGASPRCIVEDPSNQYVYTVNFNDSSITGKKIDQNAGGLNALPKPMPAPPGSPTWAAVSGSTF